MPNKCKDCRYYKPSDDADNGYCRIRFPLWASQAVEPLRLVFDDDGCDFWVERIPLPLAPAAQEE